MTSGENNKGRKKLGEMAQRFPVRLKELREQKGWTQLDLARKIDVKRSSIANYEQGMSYPPLPILEKMAKAFGVSLDGLVWGQASGETAIQDRELFEFFVKVDKLDFRTRDTLKELILALLARHEMETKPGDRKQAA